MLRILGRPTAINVIKLLWFCDEAGIGFRREDYGGRFGGIKEPPFLALNPNGRVPVAIEEDGFVMWESNTIIRYLATTRGRTDLYPVDPKARQLAERWMDWFTGIGAPALLPVFWGLIRTRPENSYTALPEGIDVLPTVEQALPRLASVMSVLDGQLAKTAFLGGDALTVADFGAGVMAYRWFELPIDRSALPHLRRWYDGLCERPGYQRHVMIPLA